jgi:hypothetical protein
MGIPPLPAVPLPQLHGKNTAQYVPKNAPPAQNALRYSDVQFTAQSLRSTGRRPMNGSFPLPEGYPAITYIGSPLSADGCMIYATLLAQTRTAMPGLFLLLSHGTTGDYANYYQWIQYELLGLPA